MNTEYWTEKNVAGSNLPCLRGSHGICPERLKRNTNYVSRVWNPRPTSYEVRALTPGRYALCKFLHTLLRKIYMANMLVALSISDLLNHQLSAVVEMCLLSCFWAFTFYRVGVLHSSGSSLITAVPRDMIMTLCSRTVSTSTTIRYNPKPVSSISHPQVCFPVVYHSFTFSYSLVSSRVFLKKFLTKYYFYFSLRRRLVSLRSLLATALSALYIYVTTCT